MNLKDFAKLESFKDLAKLDKDDLLEALGLQSKKSTGDYLVPGLLVFGAGVAVGCGIGMLLAPRPGAELLGQIGEAFNRGLEQGKQRAQQVRDQAKERLAAQQENPNV